MEINVKHISNPCEYLFFDNVCEPEDLEKCFEEINFLLPAFIDSEKIGAALQNNLEPKKKGKGVFLPHVYSPNFSPYSATTNTINKIFKIAKNGNYTPLSSMNHLKHVSGYDILLNAYGNGDYYLPHKDVSVLTAIFWLSKETVNGGDFVFTNFNHVIPFKTNQAIIFPSHYEHEVTEIKTNLKECVRFSVTAFLVIDGSAQVAQPTAIGTNDF